MNLFLQRRSLCPKERRKWIKYGPKFAKSGPTCAKSLHIWPHVGQKTQECHCRCLLARRRAHQLRVRQPRPRRVPPPDPRAAVQRPPPLPYRGAGALGRTLRYLIDVPAHAHVCRAPACMGRTAEANRQRNRGLGLHMRAVAAGNGATWSAADVPNSRRTPPRSDPIPRK